MGLGAFLTRSTRYDVTDTVTGASQTFTIVGDLAPDWATGEYRGAVGLPGAWRCAMLLSDLLGSIPWHAFRERAGKAIEKVPSPLLDQPSPPDTRMSTFSSMALDLIFHGNGIALVAARNADGYPTAIAPVDAAGTIVRRATERDPFPAGEVVYQRGERVFHHEDVIHVKGPCKPGALRGMGVLETHLDTLTLATEQGRSARAVNGSGVPTGVLKSENPDLTADEAAALKTKWIESQRTRTVAVLNASTSFEPLAWNPSETQLLEARQFSLHELGLIFGLPLSFLGVNAGSLTYSNQESEALNLVKFSLAGHLARFEQALSLAFPRGTEVKANLDALLRADTLTRYQAHEVGIRAGFLTRDEARDLEERPPLTPAQREELMPKPPAPPTDGDQGDQPEEGTQ